MSYPAFDGPRLSLRTAVARGGGPVAGRLLDNRLRDASAECSVELAEGSNAVPGDIISARLERSGDVLRLEDVVVLAPGDASAEAPLGGLGGVSLEDLRRRATLLDAIRGFFRQRGFTETSTPCIVRCPGLEPELHAFGVSTAEQELWLRTSPELALKRLLAAGLERVFEVARVFRAHELGRWHAAEFELLEWYRAYAGLEAIAPDCEQL